MIADLTPKAIWKHFYAITQIPRPSGFENEIIQHLVDFAKENNLEFLVDSTGNLIIKKKAFPGKENVKGVILQSHVDMVPQKNSDKQHDFQKDPIEALIDGEWVKANGTTLGADNGMGIAATLAILESKDIQHGPIEALFTITEETGMDGAFGLEKKILQGEVLLNLDSEEEGELFIGCAGGVDVNITAKFKIEELNGRISFILKITGLKGGHSGMDINLGRGNANLVLVDLIKKLIEKIDVRISSFTGGNLRNAIPREAEAILSINESDLSEFEDGFEAASLALTDQYGAVETEMSFEFEETAQATNYLQIDDQKLILQLLATCPNGVLQMSEDMPDVVQTSNNMAVVEIKNGLVDLKMLLRSSSDAEKDEYGKKLRNHFKQINAETSLSGAYPGWLPNSNSEILQKAKDTYKSLFQKETSVMVIHAGLECGIIGSKYPSLDMVSFGPTIKFPHSPDEKVHVASVGKFWKFLIGLLEAI